MTGGRRRMVLAAVAVVMTVAALAAYAIDPMECRWAPKCMFHWLTGWQCPGCGVSRAAHAAMHGRWAEALGYNLFFVISLPYAASVAAVTLWPGMRVRRYVTHRYAAYGYVSLFVIWWVVRNVAGI